MSKNVFIFNIFYFLAFCEAVLEVHNDSKTNVETVVTFSKTQAGYSTSSVETCPEGNGTTNGIK